MKHEVQNVQPGGLKGKYVNLIGLCAERIHESAEEVTCVELDLGWLPYLCDLIESADTNLSKGLVDLL